MLGSKKVNGSPSRNTPFKWLRRLFRRFRHKHCKFKDGKYTSGRRDVELWREDFPIASVDYPDYRWQTFSGHQRYNQKQHKRGTSPAKIKSSTPNSNSKGRERKRKHASLAQNPFRTHSVNNQGTQTIPQISRGKASVEGGADEQYSKSVNTFPIMDTNKYGLGMKRSTALHDIHEQTIKTTPHQDEFQMDNTLYGIKMKHSHPIENLHQYTADVHQTHGAKPQTLTNPNPGNPNCQNVAHYRVYTKTGPAEETLIVEYDIDETGLKIPQQPVVEYDIDETGLKIPQQPVPLAKKKKVPTATLR